MKSNTNEIKQSAIYNETWFQDFNQALDFLKNAKANGQNIYITFNDKSLYALLDTEEDCYKKVFGISKEQVEARDKQQLTEQKRKMLEESPAYKQMQQKQAAESMVRQAEQPNINKYINEGIKYMYSQRQQAWKDEVNYTVNENALNVETLKKAIKFMEALDSNVPQAEIMDKLESLDDEEKRYVLKTLVKFSKNGPDFIQESGLKWPPKQVVNKFKNLNEQLKLAQPDIQ